MKSRSDLQSQTSDDADLYATWNRLNLDDATTVSIEDRTLSGDNAADPIWDFGTSTQYPALKIDFDGDASAIEKATVEEFGLQRSTRFRRKTYDFDVGVNAPEGAVVDIVRVSVVDYAYMLDYSIVSQSLSGALSTAFAISEKEERGVNVGELTLAAGASLALNQVYMLSIQVDDGNAGTDVVDARITVVSAVAPAAPVSLTAASVGLTQINLVWEAPNTGGSPITAYKLQVSIDEGSSWMDIHTTSDGATRSYEHTGLEPETTYRYQVAAQNDVGRGVYSSALTEAMTLAGNARLIDVTTLDQLDAIRYDLDGNGEVVFETGGSVTVAIEDLDKISSYASQFSGGSYYKRPGDGNPDEEVSDPSVTAEASTTYVYKLSGGSYAGYELINDLDFVGSKWAGDCDGANCVTGTRSDGDEGNIGWMPISFFSSRFHGNEQTISNLYVNRRGPFGVYGGLFGRIRRNATLDSLNLVDVDVRVRGTGNSSYAGALVGFVRSSSIIACSSTGNVSSTTTTTTTQSFAGGLVGEAMIVL